MGKVRRGRRIDEKTNHFKTLYYLFGGTKNADRLSLQYTLSKHASDPFKVKYQSPESFGIKLWNGTSAITNK